MPLEVDVHLKVVQGLGTTTSAAKGTPSLAGCTNFMELFQKVYEQIKAFLLDEAQSSYQLDDNRRKYLAKMMDVTCLGGKYNRGLAVVDVVAAMTSELPSVEVRDQAIFDACVCGWMIEFMQAHFLIEDDIMDSSITRRGKPCWYRHPGVSVQVAINDGLIVLGWATEMALHYFANRPFLAQLLTLFHHTDYRTTIGQLYDTTSMFDSEKLDPDVKMPTTTDYKEFTIHHYKRIVKHKTSFYTYHCPLAMGALVAGSYLPNGCSIDNKLVENAAMLMGEYFQIQDDVLDCFADPAVLGKIGTDIQDTKCSWLAVTFLGNATPQQIETFKAHYGKHDDADVAVIKKLYVDTKMQERFDEFEIQTVTEVTKLLNALRIQNEAFAGAVQKLWEKTYKRKK